MRVFGERDGRPIGSFTEYTRNTSWGEDRQSAFLDTLKIAPVNNRAAPWRELGLAALDHFYWGAKADKNGGVPWQEEDMLIADSLDALRHHSARLVCRDKRPGVFGADVWEMDAGTLKIAIALLLFLNRTRKIQVTDELGMFRAPVPRPRQPKVMLAHSVIRLSADPISRLREMCAGESLFRRLHDVRGHFCHDRLARESDCDSHVWEESGDSIDTHPRWTCQTCHGKRWWRREHRRGHEEAGLVTSEYNVTK